MKRTPDDGENWGILGGTFDPVHKGHINLADGIRETKKLDAVFMIPSFNHPFKKIQATSFEHRLAMLDLATADYNQLIPNALEREANLSGYTVDTLSKLKALYPKTNFYFIIGSDNISKIESWKSPEQLMQLANFLYGFRPGANIENIPENYQNKFEAVKINPLKISSSIVRTLLNEKKYDQAAEFITADVLNYIIDRKLYL